MPLPIRLDATQTPNLQQLRIGELVVFYSYQTPIAFMEAKKMTVRDATGLTIQTKKHTTTLEPETGYRQPSAEFLANLEAAMRRTMK